MKIIMKVDSDEGDSTAVFSSTLTSLHYTGKNSENISGKNCILPKIFHFFSQNGQIICPFWEKNGILFWEIQKHLPKVSLDFFQCRTSEKVICFWWPALIGFKKLKKLQCGISWWKGILQALKWIQNSINQPNIKETSFVK